ncbi:MAG: hypothetical protein AAF492_12145, partial [Verrucomicrobiota bacterium]
AGTLAQSGGAFPRHANTAFLGQFGDSRIPNLVYIHNHFARGDQVARWGDNDVVAYERRDKRENGGMSDTDGTVLFFVMNDNYSAGEYREIDTAFPAGARLWQYANGGFYYTVPGDQKIKVITPPGGYFAFSWRSPEESGLWSRSGGKPLTIYENGEEAGMMTVERQDGPDGDPGFNPYGLPDANTQDYKYSIDSPRVSSVTNLRFVARVDGSAANVLFKLDGGWDINSHMGMGDLGEVNQRDNPPGIFPLRGSDLFLGYEDSRYVKRIHREKFSARDTGQHNVIGSAGAETVEAVIGAAGFTINTGGGINSNRDTAQFVYHDPEDMTTVSGEPAVFHFDPAPENAVGSNITIWVKVGFGCDVNMGHVYYTTDGQSFPEGAGGEGQGETRVADLGYVGADQVDGSIDWWSATLPPLTNGAVLRYKAGLYRQQGGACGAPFVIPFPNSDDAIADKTEMMGVWEIDNYNGATAVYRPHIDYGLTSTGLVEGFHILRARAFLERPNRASIYNTFVQPFYYDATSPEGAIVFPQENDTLGSPQYGVVIRTDPTVTRVWCHIDDNDPANDDAQTGQNNGNGTNALGQTAWAPGFEENASLGINSPYPYQWRYVYRNIPASGPVTISCRLAELSSSTNLALSDAEGNFTTLTRNVTAAAPPLDLFYQWPPTDGVRVGEGWIVRVRFTKSLFGENFLVKINGSVQPQSI